MNGNARHWLVLAMLLACVGGAWAESMLPLIVSMGDTAAVKDLLQQSADVNERDSYDNTPLIIAVRNGSNAMFDLLMPYRPDINATNHEGNTALHYAVMGRPPDLLRKLLEHGAELEARNKAGSTPLHLAVRKHDSTSVRILLEHGTRIEATDGNGRSPLQLLYTEPGDFGASLAILKLFHAKKANIACNDPLLIRFFKANFEGTSEHMERVLDVVKEFGCESALKDSLLRLSPILEVGDYGSFDSDDMRLLDFYLEHGGNPDAQVDLRIPAILYCVRYGVEWAFNRLIEAGAKLDAVDRDGNTVLHFASLGDDFKTEDYPGIAELYLSKRRLANVLNTSGQTPFHFAHSIPMAKLLLEHHAKINHRDKQGRTPLHFRAIDRLWHWKDHDYDVDRQNYESLIAYFVQKGSIVDASDSNSDTPLSLALASANDVGVDCLLSHGADPFWRNKQNRTYLHAVADTFYCSFCQYDISWDEEQEGIDWAESEDRRNEEDIRINLAQKLLSLGLSKTDMDNDGKTPYDLAVKNGWPKLAKVLKP